MRQAARHGIELPISSVVQSVLHGEMIPAQAMQNLLAREQKSEYPIDEAG
jgi:glycerol-3-phosphate dehydrogenase (NAD(P)+)